MMNVVPKCAKCVVCECRRRAQAALFSRGGKMFNFSLSSFVLPPLPPSHCLAHREGRDREPPSQWVALAGA